MKNHLFNIHHKLKLKLDAICQEAGDMNVKEFLEVYTSIQADVKTAWMGDTLEERNQTLTNIIDGQTTAISERDEIILKLKAEKEQSIVDGPNVVWDKYLKMKKRVKELEEQIQSMLDNYGN